MNDEYDLTMLRELAAASRGASFVEAFARSSLHDARVAVQRLEAAGQRAAWDEFRDRAHAIKGITCNVGAARAACIAGIAMGRTSTELEQVWRDDCRQLCEAVMAADAQLDAALAAVGIG